MRWFFVCIALLGIEHLVEATRRPLSAQETLEELLAVASPQWEALRKQNYSQLAIRVEEFEEHRTFEQNEIRRTRQSCDYFAAGDNKVIRRSRSSSISELEPSEQPLDSETTSWSFVTAQNARYGFHIQRRTPEEPWQVKQQLPWTHPPAWLWLRDPLPNGAPVNETLMRGLSLDPRLGIGRSDTPLDSFCEQFSELGISAEISQRLDKQNRKITRIQWNWRMDKVVPAFAEKGAIESRQQAFIDLLPDQGWQLLKCDRICEFVDGNHQTLGTYRWTSEIDYGTDESKWTYQITDTEDAARGFIKKNRFVRPLSAAEQTQLAALCQLSSFDLPEPESAATQWP